MDKDCDYEDLRKKYNLVLKQAEKAGGDEESIKIIKKFTKKTLEPVKCYYKADIAKSNIIIKNFLQDIFKDEIRIRQL